MLNSCYSQDPENRNYTPSGPPPHQFTSASSSQHGQYLHPMYAQNMYPFPPHISHPTPHTSSFQAAHGVYGGGSYGHSSSAAAGFAGIDPHARINQDAGYFHCSPQPPATTHRAEEVDQQESSGSSPGEAEEPIAKRRNWTEEENKRLVNAWLENSLDPVDGNSKKSDQYWKQLKKTTTVSLRKRGKDMPRC